MDSADSIEVLDTYGLALLLERLNKPCECEKYPDRPKELQCRDHPIDRWWLEER